MSSLRDYVFYVASVIIGGLVYVGLNWIPLIGPLAVGAFVGYLRRRGPRDGFKAGTTTALLGFLGVIYLLSSTSLLPLRGITLPSLLVFWILLLWNVVGILLAGVGGALSSMFFHAHDFLERRLEYSGGVENPVSVISYSLCSNCGVSIKDDLHECPSCGLRVR
jgi:hypothetical protein